MRSEPLARVALAVVAVALALGVFVPGASALPLASGSTTPVLGNVTGPALVATGGNATFFVNASGGPGDSGGIFSGTINWNATLTGPNTSATSVSPATGNITASTTQPVRLTVTVGQALETLKLTVKLTSHGFTGNATASLSTTFRTVVPYVVRATLVAGPDATVLPFNVTVALDGTYVGTVTVPKLAPNATYDLAFRYPSGGLGSGYHTFTLTIADAHGLVSFANGLTVQSTTFYVAPPAQDYTIWYGLGIFAFFAVLFIYSTRVAARRQGSARR